MHAPTQIPNRYELKYLIPEELCAPLRAAIAPYCVLDQHAAAAPDHQYCITSLYLDTPTLLFHRVKQAKQQQRFKLRVRTYGVESDGPVFLEVKRKIGEVVAKGRVRLPRDRWRERLCAPLDQRAAPAERDFRALVEFHGARPTLLARYQREAWVSQVDDYARVTFDRRLLYQACAEHDLLGDRRGWRPADDVVATRGARRGVVLELKATLDVPRWMAGLISRFELMRMGFSKYCTGVERLWGGESANLDDRIAAYA